MDLDKEFGIDKKIHDIFFNLEKELNELAQKHFREQNRNKHLFWPSKKINLNPF